MSVEGAESDEDQHEIMFYSLRHAATVTLKEMHHFGAQVPPTHRLRPHHTSPARTLACRQSVDTRGSCQACAFPSA